MKNKITLKFQSLRARLHLAIALFGAVAGFTAHATIVGPYTNDEYTLHLFHFDETGATPPNAPTNALAFDLSTNPQTSPIILSNVPGPVNAPADSGYPPTQFALQGQPSYANSADPALNFGYCVLTTNHSCLYPMPQAAMSYGDFVSTNTGAFTFEAMVYPMVNPLAPPNAMEIVCGDSGYSFRSWQFRITSAGQLELNMNISGPSSWTHDVFAPLPSNPSSPDYAQAGNWYHVAVTYTGDNPTNGDTAKQLRFYWTKMDLDRTNDDLLEITNLTFGLTNKATPELGVGGNARGSVFNNVGDSEGFVGYIDEVRISDIARSSNGVTWPGMMFNTTVFNEGPTVNPPTNIVVGYGSTLSVSSSETGSQPMENQWYQNGVALSGQTNANLIISNVTYAANGTYQLFATNNYGSTNSALITVTVGATLDGLFNTGCGAYNNPLDNTAPGSVDLHWTIPVDPDPAGVGSEAIIWGDQAPVEPHGLLSANGSSVWIGPEENASSKTGGSYTYQTTFQVDETVVTNTVISGEVWAANGIGSSTMQVFLNGTETDFTMPPNPTGSYTPFSVTNGLLAGTNTLAFTIQYASGNSYAGVTAFNCLINSDTGVALTNAPIITNAPVDVTNVYGATVSLSAVALGAPPLYYYWLSNGVVCTPPVWVGSTLPVLSFVDTNFGPSQLTGTNYYANYQVVFSNFVGSVTSAVATLDVQVTPLTVSSAGVPIWNPTNEETNIVVYFSGAVDPVTATTAANYTLNGANVLSAALGSAPGEVVLTTSVLSPGTSYTLNVANVESSLGIPVTSTQIAVGTYPTVALWVKAGVGVTADSSGNVSQWNDLSGNGNTLSNPYGPPYDPLLATNVYGYPVIRFNATNETFMTAGDSPSLELTSNMSVFAVMNFATLAGGTNGEIVSKTSANIAAPYDYYANSSSVVFLRGNGTAFGSVASTNLPSTGIPQLLDVVMQGTNVTQRLGGKTIGSGSLSTTIADTGQPLYIGTRVDGHNRLTGDINELILTGSALSSSDVASMENYLTTEYDLSAVAVSTNPTNILFSVANNQLTLSWPADHRGWQLQAQTNSLTVGLSTNWVNVTGTTGTNQVIVPLNLTNGGVFYRLMYQP